MELNSVMLTYVHISNYVLNQWPKPFQQYKTWPYLPVNDLQIYSKVSKGHPHNNNPLLNTNSSHPEKSNED